MNNYVDILYQNKLKNIKILNKFDDFIKICKENFHISNKKIKLIARFKNENLNYEISNQDEYFKCLYNKEFNEFEILDFNSLFIKNKNINSEKTQKEIDDLKNEIKNLKSKNLYLNNEIKNLKSENLYLKNDINKLNYLYEKLQNQINILNNNNNYENFSNNNNNTNYENYSNYNNNNENYNNNNNEINYYKNNNNNENYNNNENECSDYANSDKIINKDLKNNNNYHYNKSNNNSEFYENKDNISENEEEIYNYNLNDYQIEFIINKNNYPKITKEEILNNNGIPFNFKIKNVGKYPLPKNIEITCDTNNVKESIFFYNCYIYNEGNNENQNNMEIKNSINPGQYLDIKVIIFFKDNIDINLKEYSLDIILKEKDNKYIIFQNKAVIKIYVIDNFENDDYNNFDNNYNSNMNNNDYYNNNNNDDSEINTNNYNLKNNNNNSNNSSFNNNNNDI